MSQKYFRADGVKDKREWYDHHDTDEPESVPDHGPASYRPRYMTVGSGAQSDHAQQLIERLEKDSGYGSSIAGDSQAAGGEMREWHEELLQDRPTPAHTPRLNGESSEASEHERRVVASHVHQLYYNKNRAALAGAIGRTVELLKDLQEINERWPAHYPSVQHPESTASTRPALNHTSSTRTGTDVGASHPSQPLFRPVPPKRAGTSLGESSSGETSAAAERRNTPEPRLFTPQIAQEFSVLKLELKVGALSQAELVHSLQKESIASLLNTKISHSVRHLLSLRDRIEDTSSKVLVTGDLNAGKSTFCNALLRRKILPEDQQPCTSIFCEVLDARENGGLEEVHAVHKDQIYNRHDESTYDAYTLQDLEKIVTDNDRYMQCKVYVKDSRTIDESLLNNGVVDIALIDAPGLNSDSVKTTAVFARQEEIDVVVFVVSAANHFTLSAKEFIWQAAQEKAYIFMVVNGFDNIRDKEKCQRSILQQIAKLSPRTFKEASELVHFVSSNAIPVAPPLPPNGNMNSGDEGDGPSGPPDDDDDDDADAVPVGKHGELGSPDKGKGKDKEKIEDFGNLETALRRFVLEKRARSKLAPAKTYLLNCLGDIHVLATVNRDVAQSELDRVSQELSEIEPAFEERKRSRIEVSDEVEKDVDATCTEVYNHTRTELSKTISHVAEADLGVEYPGIWSALQFAEDLKAAMLDQITASVKACEDYGKVRSVHGVNMIKSLGLLHVGDNFGKNLPFNSEMMFRRKKDALIRSVDAEVEFLDFFDVGGLWERQEKVVGTGMAMTIVGTLGTRAIGGIGWVDGALSALRVMGSRNLRRLIIPGIVATAALTVAYVLSTIPTSLPPRLARKLSANLANIDYTHSNANRISGEVRRALRKPVEELATGLQKGVEDLRKKKEDVSKTKRESSVARKRFGDLVRQSEESRRRVGAVDLEGPLPGGAASYLDQ